MFFYLFYNGSSTVRACAESNAALFNVRAGNINFYRVYAVNIKLMSKFAVFFGRRSRNIYNYWHIIFAQFRQCFIQKVIAAGVFQTYAVKHAGRCFNSTLAFIAFARQKRCAFYAYCPNFFQI